MKLSKMCKLTLRKTKNIGVAVKIARRDKIARVHEITRRLICTKTLLHEQTILHEGSIFHEFCSLLGTSQNCTSRQFCTKGHAKQIKQKNMSDDSKRIYYLINNK